jgi:hypothetical protein
MSEKQHEGSEKRTYIRIAYRPENRPKLNLGYNVLDVIDISESGIRIANYKKNKLDKHVRGTMTLLCGETVAIDGDVVWERNGEFGLLLKHLIPPDGMEKEKKYVILKLATY